MHTVSRRSVVALVPSLTLATAFGAVLGTTGCSPAGTEHTVTIDGLKWVPAELEIQVGDTVLWDMTSKGMPHDVVSDDDLFASDLLTEGEFRHTFTEAGEFGYHCTPHPPMVGTITVVKP